MLTTAPRVAESCFTALPSGGGEGFVPRYKKTVLGPRSCAGKEVGSFVSDNHQLHCRHHLGRQRLKEGREIKII